MEHKTARRSLALGIVAITIFAILGAQLIRLQLLSPVSAPELITGEQPRFTQSEAARGLIYDRNGTPLVANVPAFVLRIVPADLPADDTARRAALVRIERESGVSVATLETATKHGLALVDSTAPVEILSIPTVTEAIRLRTSLANITAIEVATLPKRIYLDGELVAHLIGHVGSINEADIDEYLKAGYRFDAIVGQSGIEAIHETALRGSPERKLVVSDPTGRELANLTKLSAQHGDNLILSIDLELQRVTAESLAIAIKTGLPPEIPERMPPRQAAAAVAIDVRTGEILAQVSLPSFDPNILGNTEEAALTELLTDPRRPLVDRTYMEAHAPGSTFKALVAYAALEEGIATPGTTITSEGAISVQDEYDPSVTYVFKDWAAHGPTDLYQAIARSSDVYFYYLSGGYHSEGETLFEGLGATLLAHYARESGLGQPTGLDLAGETGGLVPDPTWKSDVIGEHWFLGDTYTFGIGQGYLSTSPLQMAILTAAIANGGEVLIPRIALGTHTVHGFIGTSRAIRNRLSDKKHSLAVVREGMRVAAEAGGTAWRGKPDGLTIGGKTGTAEFGLPYADGEFDTHAWYIGFAPFENPEIAVAVYVEHGIGSYEAAPVAKAMFEHYFDIPTSE